MRRMSRRARKDEGASRGAERGYRHARREGPEGDLSGYFLVSSPRLIFSSAALPPEHLLRSLQNNQPPSN